METFLFSTELNLQRNVFALLAALLSTIVVQKLKIVMKLENNHEFHIIGSACLRIVHAQYSIRI